MLGAVLITLLAFMPLAGCGFEPLMGKSSHPQVQSEMERVRIATIPNRSGQILRNYLLDAITPRGVQGPEGYTLNIRLSEPRREIAIRRDDTVSRIGYIASAAFTLVDRRSGAVVFTGFSQSDTTFEVSNSEFATVSSQASARDRALQEVSQDIRQQLAVFFAGKAPPPR